MKQPKRFKPSRPSVGSKTFNGRYNVDKLYDKTWARHRLNFLEYNPNCYACGAKATVVDHLTPHQGDILLFWKSDNMIPLCDVCHNTITSKFDRYHNKGRSIHPKLKWLSEKRMKERVYSRVRVMPVPALNDLEDL